MSFEGDVLLFNTSDGGEIDFVNGQPKMTSGFETAAYLSLFGGNYADDGLADNKKTWWANRNETDPAYKYISRFQNLSRSIPLTTAAIGRLKPAALADLAWFKTSGIADEVLVSMSIPKLNTLKVIIDINSSTGENSSISFLVNWKSYIS